MELMQRGFEAMSHTANSAYCSASRNHPPNLVKPSSCDCFLDLLFEGVAHDCHFEIQKFLSFSSLLEVGLETLAKY